MKRKIYGPNALTIGASLRNLARLVYGRNPEEGEKFFQEAVDLYARNPKLPPSTIPAPCSAWRRPSGNAETCRGARHPNRPPNTEKGLGTKHPLYARDLRDLGLVEQSAQEFRQAEQSLRQAVAIVRRRREKTTRISHRTWKASRRFTNRPGIIAKPNLSIAAASTCRTGRWRTC